MAVHSVPGVTEEQFRQVLGEAKKWRPDRRTTIIKVYCNLAEGKLVSECEAPDQSQFEEWIKGVGWSWDGIFRVDLIHQGGQIWDV